MADIDAVTAYLAAGGNVKHTAATILAATNAERQAQRGKLKAVHVVEPQTNPALLDALCRRVARNLAMRTIPLGLSTAAETQVRVGARDPEIARLEAPYRRLAVG